MGISGLVSWCEPVRQLSAICCLPTGIQRSMYHQRQIPRFFARGKNDEYGGKGTAKRYTYSSPKAIPFP